MPKSSNVSRRKDFLIKKQSIFASVVENLRSIWVNLLSFSAALDTCHIFLKGWWWTDIGRRGKRLWVIPVIMSNSSSEWWYQQQHWAKQCSRVHFMWIIIWHVLKKVSMKRFFFFSPFYHHPPATFLTSHILFHWSNIWAQRRKITSNKCYLIFLRFWSVLYSHWIRINDIDICCIVHYIMKQKFVGHKWSVFRSWSLFGTDIMSFVHHHIVTVVMISWMLKGIPGNKNPAPSLFL